ncbi:hypothetical protein SDC9_151974 [bioreactor metagenome]|uniref:Uncharacterized protein n=1 Tax=bioreactor metagenome TaxID=1076179 RepID=A0A645EU62_9ZZZZ
MNRTTRDNTLVIAVTAHEIQLFGIHFFDDNTLFTADCNYSANRTVLLAF